MATKKMDMDAFNKAFSEANWAIAGKPKKKQTGKKTVKKGKK